MQNSWPRRVVLTCWLILFSISRVTVRTLTVWTQTISSMLHSKHTEHPRNSLPRAGVCIADMDSTAASYRINDSENVQLLLLCFRLRRISAMYSRVNYESWSTRYPRMVIIKSSIDGTDKFMSNWFKQQFWNKNNSWKLKLKVLQPCTLCIILRTSHCHVSLVGVIMCHS